MLLVIKGLSALALKALQRSTEDKHDITKQRRLQMQPTLPERSGRSRCRDTIEFGLARAFIPITHYPIDERYVVMVGIRAP